MQFILCGSYVPKNKNKKSPCLNHEAKFNMVISLTPQSKLYTILFIQIESPA